MANVEIAYLRSGFGRVIQTSASRFEVQALSIKGRDARRSGDAAPTYWRKLYGLSDLPKALRLLESYGYVPVTK